VGSALFTIISAYAWGDFVFDRTRGTVFDPTRIAAQIVTGIGFLGAGAILRQGLSVRGLTTAAGLWVVAAIGMAAGAGYWPAALIGTGVVLVGLGPLRFAENLVAERRTEGGYVEIDIKPDEPLAPLLAVLEGKNARVRRIQLEEGGEEGREVRIEVRTPPGVRGRDLVDELQRLDEVRSVRWDE
jgi:putative Mg2+ transporter-C (MgtC) family protein